MWLNGYRANGNPVHDTGEAVSPVIDGRANVPRYHSPGDGKSPAKTLEFIPFPGVKYGDIVDSDCIGVPDNRIPRKRGKRGTGER